MSGASSPINQCSHDVDGQAVAEHEDQNVVEDGMSLETQMVRADSTLAVTNLASWNSMDMPLAGVNEPTAGELRSTMPSRTAREQSMPPIVQTESLRPHDAPDVIESSIAPDISLRVDESDLTSSQEISSMIVKVKVNSRKRKTNAMQEIVDLGEETDASARFGTFLLKLRETSEWQRLEDAVSCSVCLKNTPTEPCVLDCLHVYCRLCFRTLARDRHPTVTCLRCHRTSVRGQDCERVIAISRECGSRHGKSSTKRRKLLHSDFAPIKYVKSVRRAPDLERRGYPRLIHIDNFEDEMYTDSLTMADFVATMLLHYDPQSMEAFFNEKCYSEFSLTRTDSHTANDIIIKRQRKDHDVLVTVMVGNN